MAGTVRSTFPPISETFQIWIDILDLGGKIFMQVSPDDVHDMTDHEIKSVASSSRSVIDFKSGNLAKDAIDGAISGAARLGGLADEFGRVGKKATEAIEVLTKTGILSDSYGVLSATYKLGRTGPNNMDRKHEYEMSKAALSEN